MQKSLFSILLILNSFIGLSQTTLTTFGIQYKPIISADLINTGPQSQTEGDITFTVEPTNGYSFGMVIRKGFNKQISLETGVNLTKRNYNLTIFDDSANFKGESEYAYTIYEIPVMGLIYVQLGRQSYLNTAFGVSFNFLPSDWDSFGTYFEHYSAKRSWVLPSLVANIGYEYRTLKSGFLYAGFSLHRPFTKIATAGYRYNPVDEFGNRVEIERSFFDINGNYLTLDLKYFFHEDPERKRKRR